MPELLKAALSGIVEGLTEFIPVSSTGHLILFGEMIEFTGPKADTFHIFIQLGAILAVVILYRDRFRRLFDFKDSGGFSGKNGIQKLIVGTTPALILGFFLHSIIKSKLFAPFPVAIALILWGIIFIMIDRKGKASRITALEQIGMREAFLIGCFQCFALWPGTSRSGSTMIGGLLLGCNRMVAAEFSFLLAVPVMCAAVGYDLLKSLPFLSTGDIPIFAVGFIISLITAILAIRFFLSVLARSTLAPFGWYRIVLGVVVLLLLK